MQTAIINRGEGLVYGCAKTGLPDLLCFSHLRWHHVYQRPQRLMTRWAHERRVFFIEEPLFTTPIADRSWASQEAHLLIKPQDEHLILVTPQLPSGVAQAACTATLGRLIDKLMASYRISDYLLWYYTSMALAFTKHLSPRGVIYDCLGDCLSDRPPTPLDLMPSTHPRSLEAEPADQAKLARPRLGCFCAIDDRLDWQLIGSLAQARPQWQIVLCGSLPAIELARLPRRPNVHYLGNKPHAELAAYLAGWDVAIMPYVCHEARPPDPLRTAEYLASGRPVVSTGVVDLSHSQSRLVRIADTLTDFIAAIDQSLAQGSATQLPRSAATHLQPPRALPRMSLAEQIDR